MDRRSRELERQAAQGGTLEQARLLRKRLRGGTLKEHRVGQAAYLGDEVCRLVAPKPAWETLEGKDGWQDGYMLREHEWEDLDEAPLRFWVDGLVRVGAQSGEVECLCNDQNGFRWQFDREGLPVTCTRCRGTGKLKDSVPDREFLMRCALAAARHAIPAWEEQAHNRDHEEHCPWGLVRSSDPGCGCPPRQSARLAVTVAEAQVQRPCEEHCRACYAMMLALETHGDRDGVYWALIDLLGPNLAAENSTPQGVVQAAAELASPRGIQDAIRDGVVPWLLGG